LEPNYDTREIDIPSALENLGLLKENEKKDFKNITQQIWALDSS